MAGKDPLNPVTHSSDVASESAKPMSAVIAIDSGASWVLDILVLSDVVESADGAMTGSVLLHDPEWLVRMMLSLGGVAEVLAPTEMRKSVADAAKRALAAYAEGP